MENTNQSAEPQNGGTQQQPGSKSSATVTGNKNAGGNSADPSSQFTHPKVDDEEVMEGMIKEPTEEEMDEKKNNARDAMNDDSYVLPGDEEDDGKLD